jgi:transcriptional regulator with XRE-family HTH domain
MKKRTAGRPPKKPPTPLARRFRAARLAAGLTLDQAAEKAGVSYHSLQKIESRGQVPLLVTGVRLARAYGVTAEALAGEEARD